MPSENFLSSRMDRIFSFSILEFYIYSIFFRLRLLLLLLFFFLFREEDEIFIVEFDTFFFFLFLDSFPPRFGGMQSAMVSYVLD